MKNDKAENAIFATRESVIRYVKEKYGTDPEYLWRKFPECFALRRESSKKWYAVVMDVSREKLGLAGNGKAYVMDVKCSYESKEVFCNFDGILPAYHMNKEKWLTIVLDGTVDMKLASDLIDESYDLV